MALKKIDERLSRLQGLVGNWSAMGSVPRIERDIVLEELRRLYDEVLDYTCDAEASAVNRVEEKPVMEAAVVVDVPKDKDEDVASEEVGVVFDDVLDIAALLGLSGDDSIEIAERAVEEDRAQEAEDVECVEQISASRVENSVEEVDAPAEINDEVVAVEAAEEAAEEVAEPEVGESVVEESEEK